MNAILAIVITCVLTAAYVFELFTGELPCPLCMLQRLGMIGVAFGACLNLRFGVRSMHYGVALLSALFGGATAARQVLMHICPGESIFGTPVFGLSLHTWSLLVFFCSVLAISVMLMIKRSDPKWPWLGHVTLGYLTVLVAVNVATTYWQCGLGGCE